MYWRNCVLKQVSMGLTWVLLLDKRKSRALNQNTNARCTSKRSTTDASEPCPTPTILLIMTDYVRLES